MRYLPLLLLLFAPLGLAFASSLETSLKEGFMERYGHLGLEIKKLSVQPASSVDTQGYTLQPPDLPEALFRRNLGSFDVLYANAKGHTKKVFYRFRMEATLLAYISTTTVHHNTLLAERDFKRERIPFESLPQMPAGEEVFARQDHAKNHLQAGRMLTLAHIKRAFSVKRNQTVIAILQDGPVALQLEAVAQESGYVGELVTIKTREGKTLKGKIIKEGMVRIE